MEDFPPLWRMLQLILTGISLILVVFLLIIVFFPQVLFQEPRVVPDAPAGDSAPVMFTRSFPFLNGSETVSIAVSSSVYTDSKKTYRSTFLLGNQRGLGTRYYGAMINDPSQDQIYRDLLSRFREIRSERNLTDDEYLELMAAYVQTIPYGDGGNVPLKYPAELLVENIGDCDDKSTLLSGLLARGGYSVVMFKFGPDLHRTVGVGSDAFHYKSTGYTYLEAMTPAFVGSPTTHLNIPPNSDPLVIQVSSGTKAYHGGKETRYIDTTSGLAGEKISHASALCNRDRHSRPGEPVGMQGAGPLFRDPGVYP